MSVRGARFGYWGGRVQQYTGVHFYCLQQTPPTPRVRGVLLAGPLPRLPPLPPALAAPLRPSPTALRAAVERVASVRVLPRSWPRLQPAAPALRSVAAAYVVASLAGCGATEHAVCAQLTERPTLHQAAQAAQCHCSQRLRCAVLRTAVRTQAATSAVCVWLVSPLCLGLVGSIPASSNTTSGGSITIRQGCEYY